MLFYWKVHSLETTAITTVCSFFIKYCSHIQARSISYHHFVFSMKHEKFEIEN